MPVTRIFLPVRSSSIETDRNGLHRAILPHPPPGSRLACFRRPVPSTPSAPHPGDLPRQFASRDALEALLAQEFPSAEGPLSPIHGGRQAADARLAKVQPSRY